MKKNEVLLRCFLFSFFWYRALGKENVILLSQEVLVDSKFLEVSPKYIIAKKTNVYACKNDIKISREFISSKTTKYINSAGKTRPPVVFTAASPSKKKPIKTFRSICPDSKFAKRRTPKLITLVKKDIISMITIQRAPRKLTPTGKK